MFLFPAFNYGTNGLAFGSKQWLILNVLCCLLLFRALQMTPSAENRTPQHCHPRKVYHLDRNLLVVCPYTFEWWILKPIWSFQCRGSNESVCAFILVHTLGSVFRAWLFLVSSTLMSVWVAHTFHHTLLLTAISCFGNSARVASSDWWEIELWQFLTLVRV